MLEIFEQTVLQALVAKYGIERIVQETRNLQPVKAAILSANEIVGGKIARIRFIRQRLNLSLSQSKSIVECYWSDNGNGSLNQGML